MTVFTIMLVAPIVSLSCFLTENKVGGFLALIVSVFLWGLVLRG